MSKKPSLYPSGKGCFVCHSPNVVRHHIYGGHGRRPIADEEGCWVELCPYHHNMSDFGVHFDKALDDFFKEDCQRRWERREGIDEPDHETFIALMGRNYIL